jgi:hypothetical protein
MPIHLSSRVTSIVAPEHRRNLSLVLESPQRVIQTVLVGERGNKIDGNLPRDGCRAAGLADALGRYWL